MLESLEHEEVSEEDVNGVPYILSVDLQGKRSTLRLKLIVVDEDDPEKKSRLFDLNKNSKPTPLNLNNPTSAGTMFQTKIELPEGFKPGEFSSLYRLLRVTGVKLVNKGLNCFQH